MLVSVVIFNTFSCHDVGGSFETDDVYMSADYSVSCHSSRYTFAYWWALLMVREEKNHRQKGREKEK